MRRRAMSHNPKRMPRALREAHKAQVLRILTNHTLKNIYNQIVCFQMEKSGNIVKPKS